MWVDERQIVYGESASSVVVVYTKFQKTPMTSVHNHMKPTWKQDIEGMLLDQIISSHLYLCQNLYWNNFKNVFMSKRKTARGLFTKNEIVRCVSRTVCSRFTGIHRTFTHVSLLGAKHYYTLQMKENFKQLQSICTTKRC